jgi:hypothetical protein
VLRGQLIWADEPHDGRKKLNCGDLRKAEVPERARIIVHGLRLTTFLHWDRYAVPVEKPPAGFTT